MGTENILFIIYIVFVFTVIGFSLYHSGSKKNKAAPPPKKEIPPARPREIPEPSPRYSKRDLLTPHERENYIRLKSVTDKLRLEIFVKVRLSDLFEINEARSDSQTLFNWIRSKHIDFVVWNPVNNTVVLLLEIWDSSHKDPDRKRRDDFVRDIADEAGYNFAMYPEVKPDLMEIKLKGLLKGRP